MKPRIAHLISSLHRGGAETLLTRLIPRLSSYDHRVFFMHDGPMRASLEKAGVACRCVGGRWAPSDPTAIGRTFQALDAFEPAALVSHLWMANVLARAYRRFHRVPQASVLHQDAAFDGATRRGLARLVGFPDDRIVAVSESVAEAARRWYPLRHRRLDVIPNGVDAVAVRAEIQAHGVSRASLGLKNDELVVVAVGRFVAVKNLGALIDALALLAPRFPQLRVVLVGSGPLERSLAARAVAARLSDRVLLVTDQPALPYLGIADIFVQPSVTEGLSLALLEAMAVGLPVVVSAPDGMHSVVKNGETGILAGRGAAAELATALETLVTRPDRLRALGDAGRRLVERHFSFDVMAEAYDRLIRDLIA